MWVVLCSGATMTEPSKILDLNGKVKAIDMDTRTLTLLDESSAPHVLKWAEPLDIVMQKWKAGYYLTVSYDPDTYLLKNAKYWQEGKDKFPKQQDGGKYQPRKPRVTIAATVNLQNYENIKVEVESNSAEESTKILIDTLNGFATNPAYSTTRDMIQSYMMRVLNTKKAGV